MPWLRRHREGVFYTVAFTAYMAPFFAWDDGVTTSAVLLLVSPPFIVALALIAERLFHPELRAQPPETPEPQPPARLTLVRDQGPADSGPTPEHLNAA